MLNLQLTKIINKLIILIILLILSYIIKYLLYNEPFNQYFDYNYFNNPDFYNKIKLPKTNSISKIKNISNKRKVSESTKKYVASKYDWKCNNCKSKLDYLYEIDHIVPLYAGGTNDTYNLQPLCKMCHKIKTSNDRLKYN